jgi:hypothetical protein
MSAEASETGAVDLVSQALLAEVTKKVRELGLVAWVDAEGHYTAWADRLAPRAGTPDAPFPFPIVRYRSSYLELMLALEPFANDLTPEYVLVHLPGLNKDSVRETPAYELYKAGKTFEKNLATLVREAARGEARPEQVEAFLAAGNVSLESADAWLAGLRAAPRDEFALRMEAWGIEDVALGLFRGDPRFLQGLPKQGERLFEFLEKGLGVTDAWREFMKIEKQLTEGAATTLVASWLMAVEFATDLASTPSTPALQPLTKLGPFKDVCRRLAERARDEEPDTYLAFADQLERVFKSDHVHPASALGSIDTFRFEEATTRKDALVALTVRYAADAGRAIAECPQGLKGCASLEEAVERYASRLAAIDRAHRFFEQRAHALIAHDLTTTTNCSRRVLPCARCIVRGQMVSLARLPNCAARTAHCLHQISASDTCSTASSNPWSSRAGAWPSSWSTRYASRWRKRWPKSSSATNSRPCFKRDSPSCRPSPAWA